MDFVQAVVIIRVCGGGKGSPHCQYDHIFCGGNGRATYLFFHLSIYLFTCLSVCLCFSLFGLGALIVLSFFFSF